MSRRHRRRNLVELVWDLPYWLVPCLIGLFVLFVLLGNHGR